MIEWTACSKAMPTRRDVEYLLYNENNDACHGPIPWIPDNQGGGLWVDLFATPEAGESFGPPTVTHWAIWNGPESQDG